MSAESGSVPGTATAEVRPASAAVTEPGPGGADRPSSDEEALRQEFAEVWVTDWDPFRARRKVLEALKYRRPKWVNAIDADGRPPSDWYIGPVGPTMLDAIHASEDEFAEFVELAQMSAFDHAKRNLMRRRSVQLARGRDLDPAAMASEEEALLEETRALGAGEDLDADAQAG